MAPLDNIAIAAGFMAGLGLILASLLAVANRRLYVWEDPRIAEVDEMLPHSNCGACGTPGCRPFAEALVKGAVDPGQCTVGSADEIQAIAEYLNVEVGEHEKRVARLACAGGRHVSFTRASYTGLKSCRAAGLVSGGGKGCTWGCLGFGDCMDVCEFDAIHMNAYSLPVVDDALCTACGDCVEVCPKGLFSLQPVSHRLWVACRNLSDGDETEADCEVVCNGCGRCVTDAPEGLIRMENNLAVIDYAKNALASKLAIERCPTGAIVWQDAGQGVIKGTHAKKIVRRQPLPLG